MLHRSLSIALLALVAALSAAAQTPDLTKQPTLYLVGYAHLDTEWRWEYPQTIGEFLPKTMRENFALFEKYPHYVFNFSGANRYRMMKEYFPADYERLRGYVRAGRWFPAGSSMEESDVNSPSAESILRQVLYGNTFFRHELGRTSAEYMLPDCFGFPASLPTLLAHAGIRGFSTQKLTWGSNAPVGGEGSPEATPKGTPFNVGIWEGVDGRSVIAALNPGDYSGDIRYDLTKSEASPAVKRFVDWPKRVARNGEVSGVFADYHYYGTGDTGGSPSESSVALAEQMAARPDGALHVVSSAADQMFLDIAPAQTARLPRYRGDLELTNHSAGSLTSQAYQKRWNHENELLADAAEKASVAAMGLGTRAYPQRRLNDAWVLVMGGQFHDIAAGTATPKAYEYSWNDDVIAMNQFAAVLTDATESIASSLDTRAQGVPVVVYNPLNVEREDVVEARLDADSVLVVAPNGMSVPSQVSNGKVIFVAKVPPTGFAVYDVRSAKEMIAQTGLKVDESSLENARYRIKIDANGDISSILDKHLGHELLSAPMRLAFQTEKPHDWPAWNMDWDDQKQPPRGFVGGPAKVRVVENGPVRAAIEITRDAEGSKFVETISLAALGDAANRIEIRNAIDWKSSAAALKATFPLTAHHPKATYNWEVGTIERGNDEPRQFEVPSHQWIDLTDKSGAFGVTLLTGAKYGSDKPDDSTLRLTLLYTPGLGDGNGASYADQTSQDWGHHELTYGLTAHGASWREDSGWQALCLDQPLIAFQTGKHAGPLGKTFSLLRISRRSVRVLALKKAEESDKVVVRVVETSGKSAADVRLTFAAPVVEAHEVDGQERRIGSATIDDGALITEFTPYQIRSFALRLSPPKENTKRVESQAIALTADRTVVTRDGARSAPGFDDHGRNLPAEMLPPSIRYGPIAFQTNGGAVVAYGQQIALPRGKFTRLYLLAASADGDQKATLRIDEKAVDVTIEDWSGKIGQWDTRLWKTAEVQLPPRPDAPPNAPPRMRSETQYAGLTPGFIKRAPLAWFASHRHDAEGKNEAYQYSYLFAYTLDLPPNAQRLTLPDNDKIRVLAITVSNEGPQIRPLQPLYDTLER
jgi:alpha-mannosidase